MKNIFNKTLNWIKTHRAISLISGLLVIAIVLACVFGTGSTSGQSEANDNNNSSVVENTNKETESTASEGLEEVVVEEPEVEAPKAEEPKEEGKKEETPKPQAVPEQTTSAPTASKTENTNTTTNNNSNTPKYVQDANPDTGISWDGVSPIIYTYPDGTTGTEKRDGATYESYPGAIATVKKVEYIEYDGKCGDCGKIEGDGTNGTCVQWLMGDVTCPNCGDIVPTHTCHTCE